MPAALAAVSFLPEESARSVTEAFRFGPRRWPSTGHPSPPLSSPPQPPSTMVPFQLSVVQRHGKET